MDALLDQPDDVAPFDRVADVHGSRSSSAPRISPKEMSTQRSAG